MEPEISEIAPFLGVVYDWISMDWKITVDVPPSGTEMKLIPLVDVPCRKNHIEMLCYQVTFPSNVCFSLLYIPKNKHRKKHNPT